MQQRVKRKSRHDEEEEQKKKKKQTYALYGGIGVAVLVVLVAAVWLTGGRHGGNANPDPAQLRQAEHDGLEKLMQSEIDRATARGASAAEIDKIRATYRDELKARSKN
jgi:predicted NAD/FAD-binding protein